MRGVSPAWPPVRGLRTGHSRGPVRRTGEEGVMHRGHGLGWCVALLASLGILAAQPATASSAGHEVRATGHKVAREYHKSVRNYHYSRAKANKKHGHRHKAHQQ